MGKKPDKISRLPLSRERITEIVRDIARDSRWVPLPGYSEKQDWRKAVNNRQIQLCLAEGYVLEEHATLDEHGHWIFHIARVCAGLNIVLHVALESNLRKPRLFVLGIDGEHIK